MAPKKKQAAEKMSLGAFLQEDKFGGSWADEVEDTIGSQPLPPATRSGGGGFSSYSSGSFGNDRGYAVRDSFPTELPTRPPYTAHLGNLSYDATSETVSEFFEGCDLTSVRIIEDRIEQRPKGFAYAEFKDVEGLKKALDLDGQSFQGRGIRVKIADPPKDGGRGDRGEGRDMSAISSWERKGPLADLPNARSNDRRDFSERREFSDRRGPPRDGPADEPRAPARDLDWGARKGPLSPLPQQERTASREGGRPRTNDGNRTDSVRGERRASPATWGEGLQEGSRPPRGEFRDRPERTERPERVERNPTAAELDNQWRSNMKPDRATPGQSRDGSEAPSSPAGPAAAAPVLASRPKLNLAKRTVSEAPGATSPPPASATESKGNPFGAARPIDTAAKEREIADKKEEAIKNKKESDEKAKEDRRLAKEAAAKEAAEKAAAAEAEAEAEKEKEKEREKEKESAAAEEPVETIDESKQAEDESSGDQTVPTKPRERLENPKSRATESGNWRTASGEGRTARGGYQNSPRGGRGDLRGGRGESRGGRGGQRGGRFEGGRPPRANGSSPAPAQQESTPAAAPPTPVTEEVVPSDPDGWQTVPSKGRRGGTRA
ncbi:hypothetical protein BJ170DRAFT_393660 [Xylariales sp. AK1849]|nr:hypothetical protein BJ170DRAFT_393660 [Xylariales sp. AK1849]